MEKRGRLNRRLGANLREIRLARGFTQEAWAAHLGYDRTYVASVERGERNVTLDTLSALAELIEVDPLELLDGNGAETEPLESTPARGRHIETATEAARPKLA